MELVPFKTDLQGNQDYCPLMPKSLICSSVLRREKKSILEQGPCLGQVYLSSFLFWIFFVNSIDKELQA